MAPRRKTTTSGEGEAPLPRKRFRRNARRPGRTGRLLTSAPLEPRGREEEADPLGEPDPRRGAPLERGPLRRGGPAPEEEGGEVGGGAGPGGGDEGVEV